MDNKKLAQSCGADIGTMRIFGSNYENMLVFNEDNFAKFCKELVKSESKNNLHTIRLYRAFLDTLIENYNDRYGTAWERDFRKLVDRIEADLEKEAYV